MPKRNFNAKEIKNINECRAAMGMPPLKYVTRECLKCSKKFESLGIHNRICEKCGKENDRIEAVSPQEVQRLPASRERKTFAKKINDGY